MRLQFFLDRAGQYRWRLRAANGQIIAGPQEGYVGKDHTRDIAAAVLGGHYVYEPDYGRVSLIRGDPVGRETIQVEELW